MSQASTRTRRNNRTNSTKNKMPSFDYFFNQSVETLFHYIRFEVFPSVSDSQKKELFYNLSYIGCREPENLKTILGHMERKDFEGLVFFAQKTRFDAKEFLKHMVCEITEEEARETRAKEGEFVYLKKPETMIDGWFQESDPKLALQLFVYLAYLMTDDRGIQQFMKNYLSMNPEMRKEYTTTTNHFAYAI